MTSQLPDQALDARYAKFLADNVRPPTNLETLAALGSDSAPAKQPVALSDLFHQGPDPARETAGALLAPQVRIRYGLEAARPAPCVHTGVAQAFTAAGPGRSAANRPRRSDRISRQDSAPAPATDPSGLNPWAPSAGGAR